MLDVKNVVVMSLDVYNTWKYIGGILAMDDMGLGHYRLWYKKNFFLELPKKWILSKIALLNDTLLGYCIVSAYSGNRAHIHRMSTHPQFRRAGVGAMLMQHVFIEAFREGIVDITLESLCDNHAANLFYEKLGFKELNRGEVNQYLAEKDKMPKSNKYYAINNGGNRRVFSIKINNFKFNNKII